MRPARRTKICTNGTGKPMSKMRGESRRSTRVPLKVVISAQAVSEPLTCDGETIVVNRHGALISSTVPLRMGLKVEVHVIITDKRAKAEVVHVDAERPFVCGMALDRPENIRGLSFPPAECFETHDSGIRVCPCDGPNAVSIQSQTTQSRSPLIY